MTDETKAATFPLTPEAATALPQMIFSPNERYAHRAERYVLPERYERRWRPACKAWRDRKHQLAPNARGRQLCPVCFPTKEPFEVLPEQTYVPCKTDYLSCERPSKPFVVWSVEGDKVKVWDPSGGQRLGGFRWIALRNLHETGTTKTGKERKTGWRLHSGPPEEGQELCGSCFRWLDRDEFDKTAWTLGHSTCRPCKAEIHERYRKK